MNVIGKRTSDDELGQLATRFQGMVDRLREVDELERNFLMRVTHELRTPLTAISGHVQALAEGVVGPDDLDESLAAVNEEVRRLDRLVGDLLDLTRLEAHQFRVVSEEVGLAALLERAAASFREKARTNDVIFHTPIDEAPTIITDGDRVLQIVNNLLDNAFRWTPRGGTVQLGCTNSNGIAAISVSDTGRGIPPAEREAVFHPFYSRRGEGGTGLGLSIARELATALGGRLSVESEPGQGSTFTLSLPRKRRRRAKMRIRLCDTEQDVSGISVELVITAEPFADSVPVLADAARRRDAVAHVARRRADAGRALRARPRPARRRRRRLRPLRPRRRGVRARPGAAERAAGDRRGGGGGVGRRRPGRRRSDPTRSGVAVQLIVDAPALAAVAEAVCDQAARVLSR